MRFSDVQNQFGLSDWQMKWIKEKCNRSHRADRWLCYRTNMDGEKELWMYLEGVKWVEEVYLNFDVPYKTAEIEYQKIGAGIENRKRTGCLSEYVYQRVDALFWKIIKKHLFGSS